VVDALKLKGSTDIMQRYQGASLLEIAYSSVTSPLENFFCS